MALFKFREKTLPLDRPHVMGILNVTPDSFSDGGRFFKPEDAIRQAQLMISHGASIVDVGGESTRPGAVAVSVEEELDRVLPVIEALAKEVDTIISVDTSTAQVIREASSLGAHLINDVRALQRPNAMNEAVRSGLPVCLMHMQGQPTTMQDRPDYQEVVTDVTSFLEQRIEACLAAGLDVSQLIVDPGFGFGKSIEHNLRLMNKLDCIGLSNIPLLVGVSRKSMIGTILGDNEADRMAGSLSLAALALVKGAWIVRAHDVQQTSNLVKIFSAVQAESIDS